MNEVGRLRRLAAVLTVWSILPISLTGVMLPSFWLAPVAAAVVVFVRCDRGGVVLPHWLQNLLGLVIVTLVVLTGGWAVGPLRPLGHLLLLLHTVCLVMIVDRRSFQRALTLAGILWVIAVAGSSHITLIPYVVLSISLGWWTGMRILLLDGDVPCRGRPADTAGSMWRTPRPRHVATATLCVALITVPLFLVMPRLRTAWITTDVGQGPVTGFSSVIQFAGVGRIEMSSRPVMAVFPSKGVSLRTPGGLYLRGAVYDPVADEGLWIAREDAGDPLVRDSGLLWLSSELRDDATSARPVRVEMIQPDSYVFTPPGTVAVRANLPLYRDAGGAMQVARPNQKLLGYEAWVVEGTQLPLPPPDVRDLLVAEGDGRVEGLARTVAEGATGSRETAGMVSKHLQSRCAYSLESDAPTGGDPFAWFLFEGRAGHCEFFAGAMVVMLRHLEIPARLVGGYVGGQYDSDLDGLVIRQSNAHTWVEVWIEEESRWAMFDPTPAVGVPTFGELSGLERFQWVWGRLQAYWERRIITFGMGDQLRLAEALMGPGLREAVSDSARRAAGPLAVVVVVGAALVYGRRIWRRARVERWRGPAGTALRRLERRLIRAGVSIPAGASPRSVGSVATTQWPGFEMAVHRIVWLAEKELYAERRLDGEELRLLRCALHEVRHSTRG